MLDLPADADSNTAQLANISLRGEVGAGEDSFITPFAVNGNAPKRLLIRTVDPELEMSSVPGTLADPVWHIFQRTGGVESMIATMGIALVEVYEVPWLGSLLKSFGTNSDPITFL